MWLVRRSFPGWDSSSTYRRLRMVTIMRSGGSRGERSTTHSASGAHYGRLRRGGQPDSLPGHAALLDLRPPMGSDGRGRRVRNRLGGPHDEYERVESADVRRLQMKSDCARTTPALSLAVAYASSGSRFSAKNCAPHVNFERIARASSAWPKITSAAANASTEERTNGFP